MKKVLVAIVLLQVLTGCYGTGLGDCTGIPVPSYVGVSSAWVESDITPIIESSSGGPILTDIELDLIQAHAPSQVALAVAGELSWPFPYGETASSLQPELPILSFSLLPKAHACTAGPPGVKNPIASIEVRIASISNSNLEAGTDVSDMFVVVASNKNVSSTLPLVEWNDLTEFSWFPVDVGRSRENAAYLRFDDPSQFSGSTVAFELQFKLKEGEIFTLTTDEITFVN